MSGSTPGAGSSRFPLFFVMLVGAALLLAACGGGEEEPEVRTPEVVATTPAATPTTAAPTPTPTATATETIYTVEAGDTALAIAIEFDISLAELAEANGMTEAELDSLQIGQELTIPRPTP